MLWTPAGGHSMRGWVGIARLTGRWRGDSRAVLQVATCTAAPRAICSELDWIRDTALANPSLLPV